MRSKDIEQARAWAQEALSAGTGVTASCVSAAKALLELLPAQTMAEIGWDHDTYHLAGAVTPTGEEVMMMWLDSDESGLIMCNLDAWKPEQLTPNGKHYSIVPGSPRPFHYVLRTRADLDECPEGTVIVKPGSEPHMMDDALGWISPSDHGANAYVEVALPWTVLRWGWDGK